MTDQGRLAALLEHSQDLIAVLNEDGVVRYVSPAVTTVLGVDPHALVGSNAFDRVHPDDREAAATAFAEAIATGERREAQHRFEAGADEWVWLETVASGKYDEALDGYVVTTRDVSERRRAERERRETRDRLAELSGAADDVLWMFTGDWSELLFVNDAYEEIYGRSVDRLRADPADFIPAVHPEDRDDVRAAMERLSGGSPIDVEYRVNEAENFRRWVWAKGRPIVEDGAVVRVAGFTRDISERREYQRQLTVMDRVLRHNLHNDMNVVLGYAEQARARGDESVREDIERSIQRCQDLLDTVAKQREIVDLLDPNPSREVMDLSSVVRSSVDALADAFPEVTVHVDAPDEAPVRAIPEVQNAVEEVLDNACKHACDDGGVIHVSVRRDGESVVLEVADRGPGIPEEEIGVLTGEREEDPLYHGSGLGLWLVNWIVRRSDGNLSFEPNEPTGSRVRIRLPAADR